MRSVISQCRSQLQLGWSGQTSLSLCQQGTLEITRHTTLIDAAMVYTPHFRRSKMAGINSLLLDGVGGGEGETRKHLFMIFSFKSLYLILQSVKWQGAYVCVCRRRGVLTTLLCPLRGFSQLGTNPPTTFFLQMMQIHVVEQGGVRETRESWTEEGGVSEGSWLTCFHARLC